MAYEIGNLIEAVHFNGRSDDAALIYAIGDADRGYGQHAAPNPSPFPLVTVPVGKLVEAQEWTDLVNAILVCLDHQGTVAPEFSSAILAEMDVGDLVQAHESNAPTNDPFDINGTIFLMDTNRLNAALASVTNFTDQLVSTRSTAWSNAIQHRFTAIFGTADPARYYFNSSGLVSIRGSRSGGSATAHNSQWTTLLNDMGTVSMGVHGTTTTGIAPDFIASAVGYYELSTGFQTIYNLDNSHITDYGDTLEITIEARTMDPTPVGVNNDNGRRLEFRVTYTDGYTSVFGDVVDGTITSNIDLLYATSPLFIDPPALTTGVPLTSGS